MTKVMIGLPSAGQPDLEFVTSLQRLKIYDEKFGGRHLDWYGWIAAHQGTNVTVQRNKIVRLFLETDAEWLLFIDDDETFDADLIERLLESADKDERPIMSGLVMAYRPQRPAGHRVAPACVIFHADDDKFRSPDLIPAENPWRVGAVGAGCLFVHRSVYEKIGEAHPDTYFSWFENKTWTIPDDRTGEPIIDAMGEDYVFSLRAATLGFPIYVDTDIVCGHRKLHTFTPADFWGQVDAGDIEPRTYVIIPVKDRLELTKALIGSLNAQGGHHGIIVVDNGSDHKTRRWLDKHSGAVVLNAPGLGIHEMWNMGWQYALARWPKCNLAFLNNDLRIGPDFLASLSSELRHPGHPELVAVSPNYDGRDLEGLLPCRQICAGIYDGTGGAPGFAFMVKSELFSAGYRFPEDCMWWFGDNDLLLTIRQSNGIWALTPKATVEHVGGGGQTGDWDAYTRSEQYKIDRDNFAKRWPGLSIGAAT